ncbi:MAG: hypothetical protein K6F94_09435 [Bacteroidaceae bacterium]|nr:hypothetical protein [Bacteroidaceae bacterium]
MKIIKLAAIFVVFAGCIFLAINWNRLFTGNTTTEYASEDKLNITDECNRIREAWASESGWNEALYREQRVDIDQSKAMKMFSLEGFNKVNNCLRETAVNKACEGYNNALHSDSFNDAALQKQFAGVSMLSKAEKMENDPRIANVTAIHKLYTNVNSFVHKKHFITPKFDTRTTDWRSFVSLQNSLVSTAKSYLNNRLFKEIKHLPGFQQGLEENRLRAATNGQRPSFYTSLSRQIVDYFSTLEATQDNLNLLNQIYKNFANEETRYGLDNLATIKVEMDAKVNP